MRALDCVHEAHDDMHLTGTDNDDLMQKAMQHRNEYHPEMSDDALREYVTANAYDE
jgi:hypothetical protein